MSPHPAMHPQAAQALEPQQQPAHQQQLRAPATLTLAVGDADINSIPVATPVSHAAPAPQQAFPVAELVASDGLASLPTAELYDVASAQAQQQAQAPLPQPQPAASPPDSQARLSSITSAFMELEEQNARLAADVARLTQVRHGKCCAGQFRVRPCVLTCCRPHRHLSSSRSTSAPQSVLRWMQHPLRRHTTCPGARRLRALAAT